MKDDVLKIGGMTCQHCVMAVKKELSKLPGVDVKEVSIGSARVAYDEKRISDRDLRAAVEEAGYSVI